VASTTSASFSTARIRASWRISLAPELGEAIRAAQAELEQAILEGKLQDDPLRYPLAALSTTLGTLHRLFADGTLTLSAALKAAQQPISEERLARLEQAAVRGADRQAAALARAHNLRTVLIAAGVLVGTALATLGGGYWWGRSAARADIHQTEAGLQAAFSRGPEAAKDWLALMIWNDPRKALAQCQGAGRFRPGGPPRLHGSALGRATAGCRPMNR